MSTNRVALRLLSLYSGLVLFGVSMVLLIRARLGLDPWDVLHQGLARQLQVPFGDVVIGVSAAVLLLWLPLRQRPGLGTVSNVLLVGLVVDATLPLLPTPGPLAGRASYLLAGILLNAVATALYLGARFGPGARDGLMTGLASRGHSIRLVRSMIEVSVLAAGWFLGGSVGVGTLLYALSIGPLVQLLLPILTVPTSRLIRTSPERTVQ